MTALATAVARPTTTAPTRSSVRTDIQALRALAVTGVLLYHLWPNRLTGGYVGVDVFFVISGFLITSHLIAHPPARASDLFTFWSRRIRRLLPAALLVSAAVLVASHLVAPATQWENTAVQTRAAALYIVNWRLADDAVDYLARNNAASPVQHFWSLSVEEQFYLIWPVLILLLVVLARWLRSRPMPIVAAGLSLVVAASLWYSVHETAHDQARAFFVTPTRVWELGVGALLALWSARRRGVTRHRAGGPGPSRLTALLLVWGGLIAVAASMVGFGDGSPWPGWRALVPTLGCAAVIAANDPRGVLAPGRLFALRPIQWVGNVSYSIYLWHWPLVVLVPNVSGNHLGRLDKLAIIVTSLVLAAVTKRFVEDPFRRPGWGRPLVKPFVCAAVGMSVIVVAAGMQIAGVHRHAAQAQAAVQHKLAQHDPCFGSPALTAGPQKCPPVTSGRLTPDPISARVDRAPGFPVWTGGRRNCFASPPAYRGVICNYGTVGAKIRIAVVGNSHANEFLPAFQAIAAAHRWQLTTYVANSCALADVTQYPMPQAGSSAGCTQWVHWATSQTVAGHYDLVIIAGRVQVGIAKIAQSPSPAQYASGYATVLRAFRDAHEPVLAIRDSPAPGTSIPDCLAKHSTDYTACNGTRAAWMPADPLVTAVAEVHDPQVTALSLADHICGPVVCPAVIGDVPTYFDDSHLTATFVRTLTPYIDPTIERILQP